MRRFAMLLRYFMIRHYFDADIDAALRVLLRSRYAARRYFCCLYAAAIRYAVIRVTCLRRQCAMLPILMPLTMLRRGHGDAAPLMAPLRRAPRCCRRHDASPLSLCALRYATDADAAAVIRLRNFIFYATLMPRRALLSAQRLFYASDSAVIRHCAMRATAICRAA